MVTDKWILIATDSLITTTGRPSTFACKVKQSESGTFIWADAGVDWDRGTGFRVEEFVKTASRQGNLTMPEMLDAIGKLIIHPLQSELPRVKVEYPAYYNRLLKPGGVILSLFAVSTRKGKLEGYVKDFKVVRKRVVPQPSHTCIPRPNPCLIVTQSEEVSKFADAHPDIFGGDVTVAVERIMAVQQRADPQFISPPISMLVVKPEGMQWVRQNDCPDLRGADAADVPPQPASPIDASQQRTSNDNKSRFGRMTLLWKIAIGTLCVLMVGAFYLLTRRNLVRWFR